MIKKLTLGPAACSACANKMKTCGCLYQQMKTCMKIKMHNHPIKSNIELFAAIGASNILKASQWHIMKRLETCSKLIIFSPLKPNHLDKHVFQTEKYLKLNFHSVLFMHKSRAMLEGPDSWGTGWWLKDNPKPLLTAESAKELCFRQGLLEMSWLAPGYLLMPSK